MQGRHTCLAPSSAPGSLQLLSHEPWQHRRTTHAMGNPLSHLAGLLTVLAPALVCRSQWIGPSKAVKQIWDQQSIGHATAHMPARTSL